MLAPQNDAERLLLEAVRRGTPLLLGESDPDRATDAIVIRACLLRDICIRPGEYGVDPRGINLHGAFIKCVDDESAGEGFAGRLDLEAVKFDYPVKLRACTLEGVVNVSGAQFNRFSLEHSHIEGFWGGKLRVDGSLIFSGAIIERRAEAAQPRSSRDNGSRGQLILNGARIAGDLDCGGLKITRWTASHPAIDGRNARIKGNIYLNSGFYAAGAVHFGRSTVTGSIYCNNAVLNAKPPDPRQIPAKADADTIKERDEEFLRAAVLRIDSALVLDQSDIGGSVMFTVQFHATGEIRMVGATIAGRLMCDNATFENSYWRSPGGPAILARAARISGQLDFNAVEARGALNFAGATIGQNVRIRYANVQTEAGAALVFNNATVQGDIYIGNQTNEAETIVVLQEPDDEPRILKEARDTKADFKTFHNFFVGGLLLSYATIRGRLTMLQARVGLPRADVRANLDNRRLRAEDARANNLVPPDDLQALQMYSAEVGGSCLIRQCLFIGETSLYGSRITTNLEFQGTTCLNPFGHGLVLQNVQVGGHADLSCNLTGHKPHDGPGPQPRPLGQRVLSRAARFFDPDRDDADEIEGRTRFLCHGKLRADDIIVGSRFSLDSAVLRNEFVDPKEQTTERWDDEIAVWTEIAHGLRSSVPKDPPRVGLHLRPRPICLELWRAHIRGGLELTRFHRRPIGDIDLRDAHVGYLDDDRKALPKKGQGRLLLDGFNYRGLGYNAPTDWRYRVRWLAKQWDGGRPKELFRAQPYEHLTAVLLSRGLERSAYKIAVAERRNLRTFGGKAAPAKLADLIYEYVLQYGFFPEWAFMIPIITIALCTAFILLATSPACWVLINKDDRTPLPSRPLFAIAYAAETFIPAPRYEDLGNLDVKAHWQLAASERALADSAAGSCQNLTLVRWIVVLCRVLGLIFAGLIAGWLAFWAVRRENKSLTPE